MAQNEKKDRKTNVRQGIRKGRLWLDAAFDKIKTGLAARRNSRQGRRVRRIWNRVWKVGLTFVLIGVITVCLVCGVLVVYVVSTFNADDYLSDLRLGKLSMDTRSVIYVKNSAGEFEPYQNLLGGNSVWKDLDEIPIYLQKAVISIEDERFENHVGVDWKRTATAMVNLFLNRILHLNSTEYGGSTITQQLIKVTTQQDDHSIQRKINEILAAIELEKTQATKDQVLESYLNNLPLTGDLVGVGIGARYYFGKELEDLTLAESAVMASITNNPSLYDPYRHPENVRQRQHLVLAKMYELGYITKDEYIQAVNEELVFKSSATHQAVQDYYVDLVVEDVIQDLMKEYGYTYNYATNMVYYGGLNIYSAEDPKQQAAVEAIYANEANYPVHLDRDEKDPQTGFFAVDYTGRVIATIGGRGQKTENRVLNRSTQSNRSPGSSIKPLTSYGPAVALDLVHYSSVMRDAPIILSNGTKWPHNYEARSTPDNGDVLLGVALQKSLNTVAARLVQELTPQRSFDYATHTFQLSSLVESKAVNGQIHTDMALAPLALGAFTDGVTIRDMASAYAVYGSGGYYNQPYTYYKVTKGNIGDETDVLEGGKKSVMVLDEATCFVMIKLMQRVTTYGTAADISRSWPGWDVYGKTGTSESKKDVYFAGGTGYYAAASWFGYDDNKVMTGAQTGYARRLWNQAMKVLHTNLQIQNFEKPETVQELKYCTQTGLLATDACPSTDTGYYKNSNIPALCTRHAGHALNTTTSPEGTATTAASGGATTAGTTAAPTTGATAAPTAGTTVGTTAAPPTTEATSAPVTTTTATEGGQP